MQIDVPTSVGPGRLTLAPAATPFAVLWLGHGAGGGIGAADLTALASSLPALGITVVRYEQPWRVAGARVAGRPATLDIAWRETAPVVADLAAGLPLVVGGRSAGARVACRTAGTARADDGDRNAPGTATATSAETAAADLEAAAVVCLAFPLHPPGSPEKSRRAELLAPALPVLVVQGDRDTFGSAMDVAAETADRANIRVVPIPGADHGMKALKSGPLDAHAIADLITGTVAEFVLGLR